MEAVAEFIAYNPPLSFLWAVISKILIIPYIVCLILSFLPIKDNIFVDATLLFGFLAGIHYLS